MKKGLIPLLIASGMMLVGCGPQTPTLTSVTIDNIAELQADWFPGDDDREVEVTATPTLNIDKEFSRSGHMRLSTSNPEVIDYVGVGRMISAKGAGKAVLSVLYYEKVYATIELEVKNNRPEPAPIDGLTLKTIVDATRNQSTPASPVQKYTGTYEIETIERDQYGKMTLKDATQEGFLVYQSSKNTEFSWVAPGKYEYTNPRDFNKDEALMNLEPGDKISMEMVTFLYSGRDFEAISKITGSEKISRPAAESITLTNEESEFEVGKTFALNSTVLPAGSSQLVTYEVANGTGEAVVDADSGYLTCIKEGTVTVTLTSKSTPSVKLVKEVTILPSTDKGLVVVPQVATDYVMSFEKAGTHYYYTGEVQSSYYGKSDKSYSKAVPVQLENAGEGKYKLSYAINGQDKYLGVVEENGHINFKWELTQETATIARWDNKFNTLIFTNKFNGVDRDYFFCTDSTNSSSSFRAIEVEGNLPGTRYIPVHFHSEEPTTTPTELKELTVAQAIALLDAITVTAKGTYTYNQGEEVYVTGYVTSKATWSDQYGNGDFFIGDATDTAKANSLQVYRFADKTIFDSLQVGVTKVKIKCQLAVYSKDGTARVNETNAGPSVTVLA